MGEINTANKPRPHRPGDPLADRWIVEDAGLDHTAVEDFRPLKPSGPQQTVPQTISPDRWARLRLARNLVILALLVILAFALIAMEGVDLVRRAGALQPAFGWMTGGIISALLLLLDRKRRSHPSPRTPYC